MITEVAKEKKKGSLNGSTTAIQVNLLLDYVIHWLIGDRVSQGKEDRSSRRERGANPGDALMCCFDWSINEVAKEKKAGVLNESAESIKVMLLFDCALYWLIDDRGSYKKIMRAFNGSATANKVMH